MDTVIFTKRTETNKMDSGKITCFIGREPKRMQMENNTKENGSKTKNRVTEHTYGTQVKYNAASTKTMSEKVKAPSGTLMAKFIQALG